jgi:DNA polymerase III subunit delta'
MPFRDIPGHKRIVELLARSIERDALPPSLLFAGPKGSGKLAAAVAVAQALNCSRRPRGSPRRSTAAVASGSADAIDRADACGECSACLRIARGVHADVLVVAPGDTGSIKIEQIRESVDRAGYRPFEGARRVVIVDDADAMMAAAQNALLKTLEEPSPTSVFILVSSRPDVLLPTVRSRCIRLWFAAAGAEPIDRDARDVAARALAHAAAGGDAGRRLDGAKELLTRTGAGGASDRDQLASHLHAMAALLRDVEVLGTGADAGALANPDARATLDRLLPAFRGDRAVRAFAAIDEALAALERNAGVKVVADWVMLQV